MDPNIHWPAGRNKDLSICKRIYLLIHFLIKMGLFAHWVISPISWVTGVILVKRQWNCIFPFLYPTMIILTEIDLCCRENLVSAGQLQYYSSSVNPIYLYSLIVKFQTWMHIQLFCYCFFPNQLVFIGLFIFYICHPESFRFWSGF